MTEETIINGVDVSGCKYFQIEANTIYPKAHYCGSTFNRFCEDDENCVYKQLKRLEQKNAKLKEKLEKIQEFITNCYYDDTVKCNWSDSSVVPNCEYINECKYKPIDYLLHNIIEGEEDE